MKPFAQWLHWTRTFKEMRKQTKKVQSWGAQVIGPSLDARHQDGWERPQTRQPDKLARGSRHHRQPLKRLAGLFQGHAWDGTSELAASGGANVVLEPSEKNFMTCVPS